MPEQVRFATKITLGRRMLTRALDAGVPAAWATADEFYGGDQHPRRDLRARGIGYLLAVAKSHRVTARAADDPVRADRLTAGLPARAWNRISAGAGSNGKRHYDWAWIAITPPDGEEAGCHSGPPPRKIGARPARTRTSSQEDRCPETPPRPPRRKIGSWRGLRRSGDRAFR